MKLKTFILILGLSTFILNCKSDAKKSDLKPNENTTIEMVTDYGVMHIKLYDATPKHRDNFIKVTEDGILDSLLFHRVINKFMIQGGDINSKNAKEGDTLGSGDLNYMVDAEISPNLFHKKGVLAAARDNNPERASSSTQFFLVQGTIQNDSLLEVNQKRINGWLAEHYLKKDLAYKSVTDSLNKAINDENWDQYMKYNDSISNLAKTYTNFTKYTIPDAHREVYKAIGGTPHLDQNYTVFGEVVMGIDIIDSIAAVQTNSLDRPLKDVRIKSVKVLKIK